MIVSFQRHVSFSLPENLELPIWRYLDLPRLLNLVQSHALHFARADVLGDPFEGSITRATFRSMSERAPRIARTWRLKSAVSCWHMNEAESAAMWDVYGQSCMAIAVRSTVARLIRALDAAPNDVYIGVVKYVDYDRTAMQLDNAFGPLLHKRLSFEHERELRAVTSFPTPEGTWDNANNRLGIRVPVHIEELIEAIYVAPGAPAWYVETLEEAIRCSVGCRIELRQSRLGEDPFF